MITRPLLRTMRAIADECDGPGDCMETAVSRGLLPESFVGDSFRAFESERSPLLAVPPTASDFVLWASLGAENIATAEGLAVEHHRHTGKSKTSCKRVVWQFSEDFGVPVRSPVSASERLDSMGLGVFVPDVSPSIVTLVVPSRINTGTIGIDRLLSGGLRRGTLTFVGGAMNTGKTKVAAMIAAGAENQGWRTKFNALDSMPNIVTMHARLQGFDSYDQVSVESDEEFIANAANGDFDVLVVDLMTRRRGMSATIRTLREHTDSAIVLTVPSNKTFDAWRPVSHEADSIIAVARLSDTAATLTVVKSKYGAAGKSETFMITQDGRWQE